MGRIHQLVGGGTAAMAAVGVVLLWPAPPPPPAARTAPPPAVVEVAAPTFPLRVSESSDAVELQVATRTLAGPDARVVVLAGTVHIGESAFYDGLVERLEGCDRVLYEGLSTEAVAEEVVPDGLWEDLARLLHATHQLDAVDVERPGWQHTDLSVEALRRLLLEAGADADWVTDFLETPLPEELLPFLEALRRADPRARAHTRLVLIDTLADPDPGLEPEEEALYERFVIGARNARVVDSLPADPASRAGVLYGAAHLPDLELRLRALGFARVEEGWHTVLRVPFVELGLGPVQLRQFRAAHGRAPAR